jgi:hypothetical protein
MFNSNDVLYKNYIVIVRVNNEVEKLLIDNVRHFADRSSAQEERSQEEHMAFFATKYNYSATQVDNEIYVDMAHRFVQSYLNNQSVIDSFNEVVLSNSHLRESQSDLTIMIDLECTKNDDNALETLFVHTYSSNSFDKAYKCCLELADMYNSRSNRREYDVIVRSDSELSERVRRLQKKRYEAVKKQKIAVQSDNDEALAMY